MGSTYVVGKMAAVCADSTGQRYWAIAERSYCSNVFPQTPHWEIRCFGSFERCMGSIINTASCVEGGMVKGTARTASAFISQWRKALASPVALPRHSVELQFGRTFSNVSESSREQLVELAAAFPKGACITKDVITIDTRTDEGLRFAAAATATPEGQEYPLISAWRLWTASSIENWPAASHEDATVTRAVTSADLGGVRVLRMMTAAPGHEQDHLIVSGHVVRNTGWAYSTMGSFIRNEVYKAEMTRPGSAEVMIQKFRKVVEEAPETPEDTVVVVRRPENAWHLKKYHALLSALGGDATAAAVRSTYGHLKQSGLLGDLRYFPAECVDYQVVAHESDLLEVEG